MYCIYIIQILHANILHYEQDFFGIFICKKRAKETLVSGFVFSHMVEVRSVNDIDYLA